MKILNLILLLTVTYYYSPVEAQSLFPTSQSLSSLSTTNIEVADVDLDGDLDVVANSNDVRIYYNDGAGNFGSPQIINTTPVTSPGDPRVKDITGDGLPEIISLAGSPIIVWYENLGGGIFSSENIVSAENPNALNVLDLDSDGDNDFVYSRLGILPAIVFMENLGGAVFALGISLDGAIGGILPTFTKPTWDDFDLDGDQDLIIDEVESGSFDNYLNFSYYENMPTGELVEPVELEPFLELEGVKATASPDVNGDGLPDAVFMNGILGDRDIKLYLNLGGGSFGSGSLIGTFSSAAAMHFADLDSDGDQDMLAVNSLSVNYWLNDGSGAFTDEGLLFGGNYKEIESGDLNGDSATDLVISSTTGLTVYFGVPITPLGCPAPTGLTSAVAGSVATVSWDSNLDFVGVRVEGRKIGAPNFKSSISTSNSYSINIPSGTYEWRLKAQCASGDTSVYTALQMLAVLSPKLEASELLLFPTVASELIHAQHVSIQHVAAICTDGKYTVLSSSENSIDINSISPGAYIMRIEDTDGQIHKAAFVKQ